MSNPIEGLTEEEILARLKATLPVEDGYSEPKLDAYLERLDELFGREWQQDVQATAKGVRCEITLDRDGYTFLKRSAISNTTTKAIILCCYILGMGRSQTSIPE